MTCGVTICFRVISTFRVFFSPGRWIVSTIFVLGTPFSSSLTRSLLALDTSVVSMAKIKSPAFRPAKSAGMPSIGSAIITWPSLFRWRINAPMPPYSPVVIRFSSSISCSG